MLITYAATRYGTTKLVVKEVEFQVLQFLETQNLYPGVSNRDSQIDDDTLLESRQLLGSVWGAGGMYYWWNEALGHWGLGALLFSVGALIPFYRSGGKSREPSCDA